MTGEADATPSSLVAHKGEPIMKRLHVHVAVEDLQKSIAFYSTLFAAKPAVLKPDHAKWMLDDPRVNFAISKRGHAAGLDHLGIQVESGDELGEIQDRLKRAEGPVLDQGATTCCYAQSEKSWTLDPQGIAWEAFHTTGESTIYGDGFRETLAEMASACCVDGDALNAAAAPKAAESKKASNCGCAA
jgi:catechol 2,3-dioxygenase-like lactoylglutathione lyase family enzyme